MNTVTSSTLIFTLKNDLISDLPQDMSTLIFQKCCLKDLGRFERVCKTWQSKAIIVSNRLWKKHAEFLSEKASIVFSSFQDWENAKAKNFEDMQMVKSLVRSHQLGAFSFEESSNLSLVPLGRSLDPCLVKLSWSCESGNSRMFFRHPNGSIFYRDFSRDIVNPQAAHDSFIKDNLETVVDFHMRTLIRDKDYMRILSVIDDKVLFEGELASNVEVQEWRVIGSYLLIVSSDHVRVYNSTSLFKEYKLGHGVSGYEFFQNILLFIDSSCRKLMTIHIDGGSISHYTFYTKKLVHGFNYLARRDNLNFAFISHQGRDKQYHVQLIKWKDGDSIQYIELDSFSESNKFRPHYLFGDSFYLFDFDSTKGKNAVMIHQFSLHSEEKSCTSISLKHHSYGHGNTHFYRHLAVFTNGAELIVYNLLQNSHMSLKIPFIQWEPIHTNHENFLIFVKYKRLGDGSKQEVKVFILDLLQLPTENHIEALDEVSFSFNISSREKISQWLFDGKILVGVSEDNTYSFSYPFRADMQDVEMKDSQQEIEERPTKRSKAEEPSLWELD